MSNLVKVVGTRISEDLYSKLVVVSRDLGEDVSVFVRRAILKETQPTSVGCGCVPQMNSLYLRKLALREIENRLGDTRSERIHVGIDWLAGPENLDAEGWAPLDKFTEIVGGPEMVQHMLREGIIMLHASKPNKVRLVGR